MTFSVKSGRIHRDVFHEFSRAFAGCRFKAAESDLNDNKWETTPDLFVSKDNKLLTIPHTNAKLRDKMLFVVKMCALCDFEKHVYDILLSMENKPEPMTAALVTMLQIRNEQIRTGVV